MTFRLNLSKIIKELKGISIEMKIFYNFCLGLFDFVRIYRRINKRAGNWTFAYKNYRNSKSNTPPVPPVLQIVPTEKCNLRCPMCNQWGETGYFIDGKRSAAHADFGKLSKFLNDYQNDNKDFTLSIHGGEPFVYKEIERLIDFLEQKKIDSFFTTNGMFLGKYAKALARINRHTFFLVSMDGGKETHDKIRGKGVAEKVIESVRLFREECIKQNMGTPKIIVNYCVCEHNLEDIEHIINLAKELKAWLVNYNYRWFMPEKVGVAYDKLLENEFKIKPTQTWTGWVVSKPFDDEGMDKTLEHLFKRLKKIKLFPPYLTRLPKFLNLEQSKSYYRDHNEVFGIRSCIMPSYWSRIHSSGEMIYCPGHPDIVPGNVFEKSFLEIYFNETSTQLRKHVEEKLLPICNRCCGLYMTYPATKLLGKGYIPKKV